MPVYTPHPEYARWATHWRKMRDVVLGQEAMERVTIGARLPTESNAESLLDRDYYLPRLGGQDEAQYRAYVKRASFYNATARTIDALVGAIFRRDPVITASEQVEHHLEDVDLAGTPLSVFAKIAVAEVLTTGRYGVLVDMPAEQSPDLRPYWTGYRAEDILSWQSVRRGGAMVLQRVVLRECGWSPDAKDEFGYDATERFRVLDLDDSGAYRVRLYDRVKSGAGDELVMTGELFPTRYSERLSEIPFVFMGPVSVGACPERPPLLDLADVNLAHYRKAADYAHGLHFTALPTPWIADQNIAQGAKFPVGSEAAWAMSELGKCGMLEFSGAGLGAIREAMQDDETRMAHLGAELLMPDKRAAEAADTLRIRSGAKTASLSAVAQTGSWVMTKAAEFHAWWLGESDQQIEDTSVQLNTEFAEARLDPQELTAWVAARQAGEVTRRMFLDLMASRESLGEQTVEEALVELEGEADSRAERDALKAEAQRFADMAKIVTAHGESMDDPSQGDDGTQAA